MSTRNDLVAIAPHDEEISLAVAPGEVAGFEPAFIDGFSSARRVEIVAGRQTLRSHQQFAGIAWGDLISGSVNQAHLSARYQRSHRAWRRGRFLAQIE